MKPLEAWAVISRNLKNYYLLIASVNGEVHINSENIEAEVMCYEALRRMEEQERMQDNETT